MFFLRHTVYIIIVRFISYLTTQSSCRCFDLPLYCPVAVLVCRRFDHTPCSPEVPVIKSKNVKRRSKERKAALYVL